MENKSNSTISNIDKATPDIKEVVMTGSTVTNNIQLPTKPQSAMRTEPKVFIMYGQTKVGKTTMLAKLPNCLIIDTEEGTALVESMNTKINSLEGLRDVFKALVNSKHTYDFIALDTINNIVNWLEREICTERGVQLIGDIPYGAGYDYVRTKTMDMIREFKRLTKFLIIVSHRKKIIIGEKKIEVDSQEIELTGKLKSIICADADAIGYIYRDKAELMISFISNNNVEAGSRCNHLKNKSFIFEWNKIYPNFLNTK